MARRLGLSLTIAHVVKEPPAFPYGALAIMGPERQARRDAGAEHLSEIVATMGLLPETHLRVESGDTAEVLVGLA